jgi:predicted glycoside hydrolase/deacetylase ChbG (UPF0249 family)
MTEAYQAHARRIWLCADDYGIAPGVNAAIRDLIAHGRLNATSVMVVAPSFGPDEAHALARLNTDRSRAALGLHLTLTSPFHPLGGSWPLRHGEFAAIGATLRRTLVRGFDPAALRDEVEAQLSAFVAAFGRPPDFVDGHLHVHLLPQVRDAVLAAMKRSAPSAWVRQCGEPGMALRRLRDPKGMLIEFFSRGLRARATALGVATNPAFAGTYLYGPKADLAQVFPGFLERMRDGGVVMCHPGIVDAELQRVDRLTRLREREYAYLASDTFTQALAQACVQLAEVPHRKTGREASAMAQP